MTQIPDFTETEVWVIRTTLRERYGKDVALQLADTELKTDPAAEGLTWCPAVFWTEKGANFVVFKIGPKRYRAVFYYHPNDQLGTGHDGHDELGDCVINVLQVQADYARRQRMTFEQHADGSNKPDTNSENYSPFFWGE